MGPDLTAAPAVLRCPSCAGAVKPDAQWCGQCYRALRAVPAQPARPAEPGTPSAAPSLSPAPPASSPAVPAPATRDGWPCGSCGTANAFDVDACAACGTGFLAALKAEEEPLLVLPGVGDLTALPRAARLGLAAAVVLLVVLLTALGGLLLG